MNLVAYSDSDDSDNDAGPAPPPAPKPVPRSAPKPNFHKVVDRTNPGRIKVSLPSASNSNPLPSANDAEANAPPAKKARTGGGAFSGFNAMLPAPKKANLTTDVALTGENNSGSKKIFGKKFKPGVSLKTSSEPAFSRRTEEDPDDGDDAAIESTVTPKAPVPPPAQQKSPIKTAAIAKPITVSSRFVPLSVANARKRKKQKLLHSHGSTPTASESKPASATEVEQKPVTKPKISLFSITQEEDTPASSTPSNGKYQPLLFGASEDDDIKVEDTPFDYGDTNHSATTEAIPSHPTGPQTLSDIASSLKLSEAERRQLFGRKRGINDGFTGANIVEFNTDAEYAHNERIRATGETVQHHALKSISGTGKNSLKSLINVATTQKEALEDHFAQGRRNKKEAGNKYGW